MKEAGVSEFLVTVKLSVGSSCGTIRRVCEAAHSVSLVMSEDDRRVSLRQFPREKKHLSRLRAEILYSGTKGQILEADH